LDQLYANARFRAEDAASGTVIDVDCADESPPGHRIAVEFLFNWLEQRASAVPVLAVGHHVVLGGPRFSGPARIDAPTLRYLQALAPLAPARQPPCLLVIRVIARRWRALPQVASFETAFLRDVPALGRSLPLVSSIGRRGIRYSPDGLAFESVVAALPAVDERAARGRTIVVHVSGGASLCALDGGRGVAMTARFGDLDRLPATRSRPLDPGAMLRPMGELRMDPRQTRALVGERTKLLGRSDLADALDRLVRSNEPRVRIAVEALLYGISRELEALTAALSGLDAIVFTAAARPHAAPIRAGICRLASHLGVDFDPKANQAGEPRLTRPGSRVTAWAIPTDERLLVARHTRAVVG
jgi:acetate kinase